MSCDSLFLRFHNFNLGIGVSRSTFSGSAASCLLTKKCPGVNTVVPSAVKESMGNKCLLLSVASASHRTIERSSNVKAWEPKVWSSHLDSGFPEPPKSVASGRRGPPLYSSLSSHCAPKKLEPLLENIMLGLPL